MKGQGGEHIPGFILFYLVLFGVALFGKVYDLFAETCFGWKTLQ